MAPGGTPCQALRGTAALELFGTAFQARCGSVPCFFYYYLSLLSYNYYNYDYLFQSALLHIMIQLVLLLSKESFIVNLL